MKGRVLPEEIIQFVNDRLKLPLWGKVICEQKARIRKVHYLVECYRREQHVTAVAEHVWPSRKRKDLPPIVEKRGGLP